MDSLRDDEVALIAGKLDQLPAGADGRLTALFAAVFAATLVVVAAVIVGIALLGKWAQTAS